MNKQQAELQKIEIMMIVENQSSFLENYLKMMN
jgi:hypothetical protein